MPRQTRWLIRAGLLWFVAASGAALVGAVAPARALPYPTILHMLTVGWLTQLILGVGFWMFPSASKERPRGHEGFMTGAFVLLNAGLVLRVLGEPLLATPAGASGLGGAAALVAAGAAQASAALLGAAALWPRIRGVD